ncbi:hypothetical protein LTR09_011503 [Extremus antarcticus]|uniref:Infection structure specific protein n=1 Tax=Extremus antarcticus TaxID=702011 RepID=A0AAJ0DBX1_9PEZI|nr:hypothetical protein LTR09_011503 [Extremus antarcticus]
MRNTILPSALAFACTFIAIAHASPPAFPSPTHAPTALHIRDSEDDLREFSRSLASATSAIADSPSNAASIYSELRQDYSTILANPSACDSSRWSRITDAIGSVGDDEDEEGLFDGLRDAADGLFSDDDDQCSGEENGGTVVGGGVVMFGALAAAGIVAAALV